MLLGRVAISALVLFELLNLAGVLKFTLDFSWLGLLATSVVSWTILEGLYYFFRKRGASLSGFPYFFAAVVLWLDVLGDVAHFYGRYGWYDQVMHLVGGGAVMVIALAVFSKAKIRFELPIVAVLILAIGLVALLGSFYEIEEYLEDRFYHGRPVRLGDGPDTADDLMWNLIGGVAAGSTYLFVKKK